MKPDMGKDLMVGNGKPAPAPPPQPPQLPPDSPSDLTKGGSSKPR